MPRGALLWAVSLHPSQPRAHQAPGEDPRCREATCLPRSKATGKAGGGTPTWSSRAPACAQRDAGAGPAGGPGGGAFQARTSPDPSSPPHLHRDTEGPCPPVDLGLSVAGLGSAGEGGDLALPLGLLPRGGWGLRRGPAGSRGAGAHPRRPCSAQPWAALTPAGGSWVDRPTSPGGCLGEGSQGKIPQGRPCLCAPGRYFHPGCRAEASHGPAWHTSVGDRSSRWWLPKGDTDGDTDPLRAENRPHASLPTPWLQQTSSHQVSEVTGWLGPFAAGGGSQERA